MRLRQFSEKYRKAVLYVASALMILLTLSSCGNTRTGEVNIGGAIRFEMPAFPRTGSHAVQVFSEMHFSPAYRSQEIPRLLPPEGSVPITGAEVQILDIEESRSILIPEQVLSGYNDVDATKLYAVNCQVCHGVNLDGAGLITTLKSARDDGSNAIEKGLPINLNSERVRILSDGEIFSYITWGGRAGLSAEVRGKKSPAIMPQFVRLLTEEERWSLVWFLRQRIGTE
jgi:hypothetical protein